MSVSFSEHRPLVYEIFANRRAELTSTVAARALNRVSQFVALKYALGTMFSYKPTKLQFGIGKTG